MLRDLDVEALAVDRHEVRHVARPEAGARHLHALAAATTRHRHELVEVLASLTRSSATTMPRSSAIDGALTKFTSSSVWPWSRPFSTAVVKRRVSSSASRPS